MVRLVRTARTDGKRINAHDNAKSLVGFTSGIATCRALLLHLLVQVAAVLLRIAIRLLFGRSIMIPMWLWQSPPPRRVTTAGFIVKRAPVRRWAFDPHRRLFLRYLLFNFQGAARECVILAADFPPLPNKEMKPRKMSALFYKYFYFSSLTSNSILKV